MSGWVDEEQLSVERIHGGGDAAIGNEGGEQRQEGTHPQE